MKVIKFFAFLASLMWVLVSGMSMAFIGMCEGTIVLQAKPFWFTILAVTLTSLSAMNLLWSVIQNIEIPVRDGAIFKNKR